MDYLLAPYGYSTVFLIKSNPKVDIGYISFVFNLTGVVSGIAATVYIDN